MLKSIAPTLQNRGKKRRSHHNAHLVCVFGHHNGVLDYLHTGELPPLHPAKAPLPLSKRIFEEQILTSNGKAAQTA